MATTRQTQFLQAMMQPTEPPTKDPQNPDQTDRDCGDDNFDLNLIGVTIHNLSLGGTVLEKSEDSDDNNWRHGTDAPRLINSAASCLSLYDCDQLNVGSDANGDDDDIISHTWSCYLSTHDYEENGYQTPEHSPHNHFEFDYAAPYETSQQARDHLLNHINVLADKNQKLQRQLQEQNMARGRQAHNDILRAAQPFSNTKQNLAKAMQEAAAMP